MCDYIDLHKYCYHVHVVDYTKTILSLCNRWSQLSILNKIINSIVLYTVAKCDGYIESMT